MTSVLSNATSLQLPTSQDSAICSLLPTFVRKASVKNSRHTSDTFPTHPSMILKHHCSVPGTSADKSELSIIKDVKSVFHTISNKTPSRTEIKLIIDTDATHTTQTRHTLHRRDIHCTDKTHTTQHDIHCTDTTHTTQHDIHYTDTTHTTQTRHTLHRCDIHYTTQPHYTDTAHTTQTRHTLHRHSIHYTDKTHTTQTRHTLYRQDNYTDTTHTTQI